MKLVEIEMILGFYHEPNGGETHLSHVFIEQVMYPMEFDFNGYTGDFDTVINNREELERWAQKTFEEYEIFSMPVYSPKEGVAK